MMLLSAHSTAYVRICTPNICNAILDTKQAESTLQARADIVKEYSVGGGEGGAWNFSDSEVWGGDVRGHMESFPGGP